jgi:bla regulator protein blaR1
MRKLALLAVLALLAPALLAGSSLSYVWVRHDRQNISMSHLDLDRALQLRDRLGANFIWFRLGGVEYVARDAATLEAIDRLWEPYRASDPEYDRLMERLHPLEKKEAALDREHDALEEQEEHADRARLRELERQLEVVQRQLRVLEDEERRMDEKREAIERDVERRMVPVLEEAVRKGTARRM